MSLSSVVQERLNGRMHLASLPRVAQRVKDCMENGESNLGDIGSLISLDPPLTARLLRSVNSALYGLSTEVFEPEHAASILGMRGLRNLILRAPVMPAEQIAELKGSDFDAVGLWRESIAISRLSVQLGKALPVPCDAERIEICGLLANLGRFSLCQALGEEYAEVCQLADTQGRSLVEAEQEAFGFAHTELGAMLASRWSLPEDVIKATRFHHNEKSLAEVDPFPALLMAADQVQEVLTSSRAVDRCFPELARRLPERTWKLLGLDRLDDSRQKELAVELLETLDSIKV